MKITVENKKGYGDIRTYPVCDKAKLFLDIVNCARLGPKRASLPDAALDSIKALGYEIEYV